MKTFTLSAKVTLGMACLTLCAAAQAAMYEFPISLAPSSAQLSTHEVIYSPGGPIKTVWDSGNVSVAPTTLHSGDTVTFDFNLSNPLLATDLASNPDTTEMIYWSAFGGGTLSTDQAMQYDWQFLGVSGALLSADVTGTGVLRSIGGLQGVINASQTFRTLNLTDSSFAFGGIRLSMIVPNAPSGWTINSVRVNFAADEIQIVPEPRFESLSGLFVAAATVGVWWHRQKRKTTS